MAWHHTLDGQMSASTPGWTTAHRCGLSRFAPARYGDYARFSPPHPAWGLHQQPGLGHGQGGDPTPEASHTTPGTPIGPHQAGTRHTTPLPVTPLQYALIRHAPQPNLRAVLLPPGG